MKKEEGNEEYTEKFYVYEYASKRGTILNFLKSIDRTITDGHFISDREFFFEKHFKYTVENGNAELYSYCGAEKFVTVPNTLGGYAVTSLACRAFGCCESVRDVILPNSITSIGEIAFYGCTHLKTLTIPRSVTSIGFEAFSNCPSITEIKISEDHPVYNFIEGILFDKTTGILHTYFYKKGIRSYTIPNFIRTIGNAAFLGCTTLEQVSMPYSVTRIAYEAFINCENLRSIEIPDSVILIGPSAFNHCERLERITFGKSLISIEVCAFWGCKSLKEVVLPNSLTIIEDWAFSDCDSLEKVVIPWSVTRIGNGAFGGDVTIMGVEGSCAHKYAIVEGLRFKKSEDF